MDGFTITTYRNILSLTKAELRVIVEAREKATSVFYDEDRTLGLNKEDAPRTKKRINWNPK